MVGAGVVRGRIVWKRGKPDDMDRMVLLAYWPQIVRGKQKLDAKQAQAFLLSLGFEEFTAPTDVPELGMVGEGSFGFTHPMGDEYGAKLADDILEGRLAIPTQMKRAEDERANAKHEADVFAHGVQHERNQFTYQNRRSNGYQLSKPDARPLARSRHEPGRAQVRPRETGNRTPATRHTSTIGAHKQTGRA
jgi:hypothetical protein